VGVVLGNGRFFAPRRNVPVPPATYGYPKLPIQIEIEYRDGSSSRVVSDGSWRLTDEGPVRANNEYEGEERENGPCFQPPSCGRHAFLASYVFCLRSFRGEKRRFYCQKYCQAPLPCMPCITGAFFSKESP